MAALNFTPIQLYHSSTGSAVPTAPNLASGELAINITDGKLYYKSFAGVVTLLASSAGAAGDVVGPASATDNALARFDLTTGKLIQNSAGILSDAGVLTGLTGLTSSGNVTLSALTATRVPYASTGGLLVDSANLTFDGTILTAGGLAGPFNGTVGATTASTGNFTTLSATGVTTVQAGTAALPAITTTGDTNTGIFFPAADTIAFSEGGVEAARISSDGTFRVKGAGTAGSTDAVQFSGSAPASSLIFDSAGNLGLGVTPSAWNTSFSAKAIELPGGSLWTFGTSAIEMAQNAYYNTAGAYIYVNTAAASDYYQIAGSHVWRTAASGTAGNPITFTQAMTLSSDGTFRVKGAGTAGTTDAFQVAGTAPADVARITSVGELLVGTTSANGKLTVSSGATTLVSSLVSTGTNTYTPTVSTSLTNSTLQLFGGNGSGNTTGIRMSQGGSFELFFGGVQEAGGAASYVWQGYNGSAYAERMRLDSSGFLGINNTTMGQRLAVNGGVQTNGSAALGTGFGGGAVLSFESPIARMYFGDGTGYSFAFSKRVSSVTTDLVTITDSGNLLVGTTSNPWGARFVSEGNGQVATFNTSATTGTAVEIDVGANDTTQQALMVYSAGNSATNAIIYSNGNIVNRNNSYGAISDVKLKENVTDATPKLDKLNQVRIVNYNIIGSEQKQLGVVAQELEQIFPGMVDESPDRDKEGNDLGTTTKSVKYSVFVPMLIKAIQEQQTLITALTARITALESSTLQ